MINIHKTHYNCHIYNSTALSQSKKPLITSETREYQFEYICADYFEIKEHIVDRFSSWIMIYHFPAIKYTSSTVINLYILRYLYNIQYTRNDQHRWWPLVYCMQFFFRAGVFETDFHLLNTQSGITFYNLAPDGSLQSYTAARTILQYRNTPLPEINISPTQILFTDNFKIICQSVQSILVFPKAGLFQVKKENYAHCQNQYLKE